MLNVVSNSPKYIELSIDLSIYYQTSFVMKVVLSVLLHYLVCSLFSQHTPTLHLYPVESETVLVHPIESSDWNSFKDTIIYRYSESDMIILCFAVYFLSNNFDSLLNSINTDPNCSIHTLCQLFVVLISPLAPCILPMMWCYASLFDC